jgi:excisionase family DNA binding protein
MPARKVFCEVVSGIVYEDRYLYKLSKVIEEKSRQTCILRELERLKCPEIKGTKAKAKGKGKTRTGAHKRPEKVEAIAGETYSMESMMELLGRSQRRIQELAKQGRIPAHKAGPHWVFDKKDIEAWLSKKEAPIDVVSTSSIQSVDVVDTT